MRALALAVLLLAVPFAGCTGGSEDRARIETPSELPFGLLLTYEMDLGEAPFDATYVVIPANRIPGYDLWPDHAPSPQLDSPFARIGLQLTPRDAAWKGLVSFPLVDGDSYEAFADDDVVTVHVDEFDGTYPFGKVEGMRLRAEDGTGQTRATIEVLREPPVLGRIEVTHADGTEESWHLQRWDLDARWNQEPAYTTGQWWSYDAQTLGATAANLTLVYNADDEGAGGSPMYVLNAVEVEDRLTAAPFHRIRKADLASQSGILNNIISLQYTWPLHDGKSWQGSTHAGSGDLVYQTSTQLVPDIQLPDGAYTTGFRIDAVTSTDVVFARYDYAPRVGLFTQLHITHPVTGEDQLNWTLKGYGDGFAGRMEIPERRLLLNQTLTRGPTTIERSFAVDDEPRSLEVQGTAVRREKADLNTTLLLRAPDGSTPFERNASHLASAQVVSLVEVVPSQPGNWTFEAHVTEGVSFFMQVLGHWVREIEVDLTQHATDRR